MGEGEPVIKSACFLKGPAMTNGRRTSLLVLGLSVLGIAGCPPEGFFQDVDVKVTDLETGRALAGARVRLIIPPELGDDATEGTSNWDGVWGGDALTSEEGVGSPLLFAPALAGNEAQPDRITGYIYGIEVETDTGVVERFIVEMVEGAAVAGSFFRIEILEIR